MEFIYLPLFLLGTLFGSFSSVLIERWHEKKGGILFGRSECPHCKHELQWYELIPIVSYIVQRGHCRNCKKTISPLYILLELTLGGAFVIVSYGLIQLGYFVTDKEFIFTLFLTWVVGVYSFYDIRYFEIPDEIMVPSIIIIIFFLLGGLVYSDLQIFFDKHTYPTFHTLVIDHIFGAIILYTFFYIQILIPGGWHLLKKKKYYGFFELIIWYFVLPITATKELLDKWKKQHVIQSNKLQDEESLPTWIGGGDLRVALFTGLTLGLYHGVVSFIIAYIIGSIYGCIHLILRRKRGVIHTSHQSHGTEIVFGPFLGIGWILSILFHTEIIDLLYK